jgi:hypothetical protein
MPDSQNHNENMSELLKSLQSVTTLMNNLLSDIKEHSVSLALVKAKMESITENVDTLSHVVRDGNGEGSLLTRMALAEKSIEDLEEEFHELNGTYSAKIKEIRVIIEKNKVEKEKNALEEKKFRRDKSVARWQIIGAWVAGALALILQAIQIFIK